MSSCDDDVPCTDNSCVAGVRAAAEPCNGLDDNCDGTVGEGSCLARGARLIDA